MSWDLLIRNGQCVMRDGVRPLDLAIEDGRIVDVAAEIGGSAREEIDAAGLHVFPGVIDPHVHFNEPGRTDWEGWATGSAALAAGGGTCCFDMPLNSSPPTLDGPSFDLKRAAAEASSRVDFGLWGGLTPDNLDSLDELADRGVVGFKAFMSNSGIDDFRRSDNWTLDRGMTVASHRGLIVAVHAEDEEHTSGRTAWLRRDRAAPLEARDWNYAREPTAEAIAVQTALQLAENAQCKLHVVHVSQRYCLQLIEQAAANHADFPDVSSEVCPHYLFFSPSDVEALGPALKCAPPIRFSPKRLLQSIAEGRVTMIGSDHSPAPASMKGAANFDAAWGGVSGIQSTLAVLLTLEPRLPLEIIVKLTSTNVAARFGIANKGELKQGFDADVALVDLAAEYTLTREMLLDRHKLSPYVGRQFRGLVKRTIARGQTIFRDGRTVGTSRGRLVTPGVIG